MRLKVTYTKRARQENFALSNESLKKDFRKVLNEFSFFLYSYVENKSSLIVEIYLLRHLVALDRYILYTMILHVKYYKHKCTIDDDC